MKRARVHAVLGAAVLLLAAGGAPAGVKTKALEYRQGHTALRGYLAYDDSFPHKRPGVLVFHEWWGLNDYAKGRAKQLARLGYVALAADMYGGGRRAATARAAGAMAAPLKKDRKLMRARAQAALKVLQEHPLVDGEKLAAIGFCFGGTAALELARSGAELAAVVSFHGNLDTPDAADAGKIKARVLVLHGGDDPHVPAAEVAAFQKEMRNAGVDWQMITYGGAVHAFTNPAAGDKPSTGAAYHQRAARRAWAAMQLLFAETIGVPRVRGDREGIGRFFVEKVARPVGKAGKATGKAVGKAGKATGRAFKKVWEKVTGKDGEKN